MLLQKSKMNLLKLKVFFLSTLLQLCALTTTAQESPFDTMVNALISENVPVLSVEELQTKRNIILLVNVPFCCVIRDTNWLLLLLMQVHYLSNCYW